MKESVRLGKIAGVAVGINWSLLLIAGLIALGLGNGRFPADTPGRPTWPPDRSPPCCFSPGC
jgi:hypothetical protein